MVQPGRQAGRTEPKVLGLQTGLALAGSRRFRAQNKPATGDRRPASVVEV